MVSRMIIGGSAGLRMMIALPRLAPPMVPRPCWWFLVNSSMLAGFPGLPMRWQPTRRSLRRALPFFDQRATHRVAIGIVAWPPQVIILTLGASRCSRRLAGGSLRDHGGRGQVNRSDAGLA